MDWQGKVRGAFYLLAISGALIFTGCDRDHFPASNEDKLERQEKFKENYDTPTNRNNDRNDVNEVENEPGED